MLYDPLFFFSSEQLQIDPKNVKALTLRGAAFSRKGENEKAIADYTAILEIVPTDTNALYNRGVLHDKQGKLDKVFGPYLMRVFFFLCKITHFVCL